jgi:transketolase
MNDPYNDLRSLARKVRLDIIDLAFRCDGPAHLGGALSIVEILAFLYGKEMKHSSKNPAWDNRDRFILSKGHGVLAFYSILYQSGYISREKLLSFKRDGGDLMAHPIMNLNLGIESSNGSLGHGLSMSVGIAWALKKKQLSSRVFTILGDGECDEGSVWEAAMSATRFQLNNLVAFIDCNGFQSDGVIGNSNSASIMELKWKAQGWDTFIIDGHSFEELNTAINSQSNRVPSLKPKAIIACTKKGKGVSFMENDNAWHHNRLTSTIYERARSEITGE